MDPAALLPHLGDWHEGHGHASARLARTLRRVIDDRRLPAGSVLPSERALAAAIGVSRGTVVRTYARLREAGVVHTRQGSGTVVGAPQDHLDGRAAALARALVPDSIVAAVGQRPTGAIDLRTAVWAGERDALAGLFAWDATDLRGVAEGDSGYWPLGLPALRDAIAEHLTGTGLPTTGEQVIVTNGAQQAVDLVLATVTGPGDPVLVPEVTWPGIIDLLPLRGARPAVLPHDERTGVDEVALLGALRSRRAPLAYLVADFHNPTGAVLPAHVRRLIVEAAAEGGVVVTDDRTLSDVWVDAPPPPPLAAAAPDAGASVLTIGSLSKSVWGGLRVGWVRAEPGPLLERLGAVKTVLDLGNPVPAQLAALAALRSLPDLLPGRRAELARRRDGLLDALAEELPDWRALTPRGGLSCWVDLGGAAGDAVAAAARDHGVLVPPARVCHALGRDTGHLRLTLAHDVEVLREAVTRLADAWRSHLAHAERGLGRRPAVL